MTAKITTISESKFRQNDKKNYRKFVEFREAKQQEYIDKEIQKYRKANQGRDPSAMSQNIIRKGAELQAKTDAITKFEKEIIASGAAEIITNTTTAAPVNTSAPVQISTNTDNDVSSNFENDQDEYNTRKQKAAQDSLENAFDFEKQSARVGVPERRLIDGKVKTNFNQGNTGTGNVVRFLPNDPITGQQPVINSGLDGGEGTVPWQESNVPDEGNIGPNTIIDTEQVDPGPTQQVDPGPPPRSTRPNPLNKYVTTAYGISLHYMTLQKYNDVCVRGQSYTSSDNTVIIASGGRNNKDLGRHPIFINDLYIDSMKVKVVTANNSRTRGSNAIDVELTITEPIGMTFLNNLVKLANEIDVKTWDHIPFVIRIDFFGTLEDGSYATDTMPKFMCVKFIDLKISLSSRGSEYQIRAIPQSHTSYVESMSSVPAMMEVHGQTVNDFFNGVPNENRGLAKALNDYQNKLVEEKKQKYPNVFAFAFHQDFKDSNLIQKEYFNATASHVQNKVNKKENPDISKGVWPINQGSRIKEVINQVMKCSEYYKNLSKNSADGPINIHIIKTTVEHNSDQWDDIRKEYAKKITYIVEPWKYHNNKNPEFPMSTPNPENVDKVYNYIYTGKNTEVINCKIDFNTAFFISLTSFDKKTSRDNIQQNQKIEDPKTIVTRDNAFMPLKIHHTVTQPNAQQFNDGSSENVKSNSFQNSVYTSAGDMISVDLEIMGDPDLIKQDDVFYPNNLNNSLPFDQGQIFANLVFNMPEDIKDSGLYQFSGENNLFAGTYFILTVDNNFSNGKFTQILKLVRIFDNPRIENRRENPATDIADETERLRNRYPPRVKIEKFRSQGQFGGLNSGLEYGPDSGSDLPISA